MLCAYNGSVRRVVLFVLYMLTLAAGVVMLADGLAWILPVLSGHAIDTQDPFRPDHTRFAPSLLALIIKLGAALSCLWVSHKVFAQMRTEGAVIPAHPDVVPLVSEWD
jgi:hypothetical protein